MSLLVDKKTDCFSLDGICYHFNTIFEGTGCCFHYCPCQEARPSMAGNEIMRGIETREQKQMGKENTQQKRYKFFEMWECKWWDLYRTVAPVKIYHRAQFHNKRHLSEEQLLQGIIDGRLFGYVQCDIEVSEHLRHYFSNFPPIFRKTVVSRNDIGNLMKEYAEKERIIPQPTRMLRSRFILTNCTIITPLLLFYLKLGLVCKKIHRFVQYTPRNCFDIFVQSAVDARQQGDENPNSIVVAETMKLLANSSYGYQIIDRRRHTVSNNLTDEKTYSKINSKMFKWLNHISDQIMRWNLSSRKLSTRNQSLSVSLSYNTKS